MTAQLTGKFSVSASRQVQFSTGLLRYTASSNSWSFASTQYAVVGASNSNISSSYSGAIDLFGWGTSGYNGCMPYETSLSVTYGGGGSSIAGTQYDWGERNMSGYRTLTSSEWNYLFTGRSNATSKRAPATVSGVCGWILLPDSWSLPSGITFVSSEDGANSYTANSYSSTQFTTMQDAGAVFLPAAGYRYSSNGIAMVTSVNSMGYYWTANNANVSFMGNYLYCTSEMDSYMGLAVRLVYEPRFTITTNVSPSGTGTVSGAGTYYKGSTATLVATPGDSDWEFDQFVRDYDNFSFGASRWSFTVTQNTTVTAYFKTREYWVYARPSDNSWGKGTIYPEQAKGPYGSTLTFTATAMPGCRFVRWEDGVTTATRTYTIDKKEAVYIRAIFESVNYYSLSARCNDASMGSVSGSGTYPAGEQIEMEAIPNTGYKVTHWSDNPNWDNKRKRTIRLYGDSICTANFAIAAPVTITASVEPSVAGTVTGGGRYYEQDEVHLKLDLNSGYKFISWQQYNNSTGQWVNAYPDFTATENATYRALCEEATTYTVKVSQPEVEKGYVVVTPKKNFYYEGDTVYLEAIPTDCYSFGGWKRADNTYWAQVTNPLRIIVNENYHITTYFYYKPDTLIVASYRNYGLIRINQGTGRRVVDNMGLAAWDTTFYEKVTYYDCPNGELTVEAKPNDGYFFEGWSDGSTENPHTVVLSQSSARLGAGFNKLTTAYYCGTPNQRDMWYARGVHSDLHLCGKGRMMDYTSYAAPWKRGLTATGYSLTIRDSVESVSGQTFNEIAGLNSVTINSPVFDSIGEETFASSGIQTLDLGNSIRVIGKSAFASCTQLQSLTIPNSLHAIGEYAFENCSGLTNVIFGDSLRTIGASAFDNCSGLTNIVFGDSLRTIGEYAFYNCSGLKNVVFGEGLQSIGTRAFHNYSLGPQIIIPASVKEIGDGAFGSPRIRRVVFRSPEPMPYNQWAWSAVGNTAYVPGGSRMAYVEAGYAQHFTNLLEWYKLTIDVEGQGICKADTTDIIAAGDTIYLTIIPGERQKLWSLQLTDTIGNSIPINEDYSFVMPESNVRIQAKFVDYFEDIKWPDSTDNPSATKFIRDGQIFILRGDKIYTTDGRQIK